MTWILIGLCFVLACMGFLNYQILKMVTHRIEAYDDRHMSLWVYFENNFMPELRKEIEAIALGEFHTLRQRMVPSEVQKGEIQKLAAEVYNSWPREPITISEDELLKAVKDVMQRHGLVPWARQQQQSEIGLMQQQQLQQMKMLAEQARQQRERAQGIMGGIGGLLGGGL